MNQKQIKNEFKELVREEEKFINRNIVVKENKWQEKISKYVPDTLDKTLNTAFCKAFGLVFE